MRQLAPYLATIHAQNESLLSFDASTRLRLLDTFANVQIDATAEAFSKWKNINGRIEELQRDEQDRLRLLDLWTFQAHEIEEAKLQTGEDERLETEKRVLAKSKLPQKKCTGLCFPVKVPRKFFMTRCAFRNTNQHWWAACSS